MNDVQPVMDFAIRSTGFMATQEEDIARANERLQAQIREIAAANESLKNKLLQQKTDMQALQNEVQLLQSLAALSADWYWEQDAGHRFKSFSKGSGQIGPSSPDSSIGKLRWDRAGVVPLTSTWEAHRALLDSTQPFRGGRFGTVSFGKRRSGI
jgi:PAS domain-containing protein